MKKHLKFYQKTHKNDNPGLEILTQKPKSAPCICFRDLCSLILVLLERSRAWSDSPEGKYGKNSLESAQPWTRLNPLLFTLALFVAIPGLSGVALSGRPRRAGHIWHSFLQVAFVCEIKRTQGRITTRCSEAFGHTPKDRPLPASIVLCHDGTSEADIFVCVCFQRFNS